MLSPVFTSVEAHNPSVAFFDPWDTDTHENAFVYPSTHEEPLFSFSSDSTTPKTNTSSSGSDTGGPMVVNPIDERKQRRMISNRESARRSRMRKQKHLENLRSLVNRHKLVNRELTNRQRVMSRHEVILRQENERLRSELGMLRQRLWDLHQVMLVWQLPNQLLTSAWPCNNNINNNNINVTSFNEQNHPAPSIIT